MATKKGGLGRGLDALFADAAPVSFDSETTDNQTAKGQPTKNQPIKKEKSETKAHELPKAKTAPKEGEVLYISVHDIAPNKAQPRKSFNEEKLNELAASIIEHGILQPIVVRSIKNGYEIVAGERRFRAARIAGLKDVPCIIKELTDEENALFAIIENMQREDLNPVEEAEGIRKMMDTYGLTQEEIAKSVGKSRPYIANSLRLLSLPEDIQKKVSDGLISAAHGRTLAGIGDSARQSALAEDVVKKGLSVRELERLATKEPGKGGKKKKPQKQKDANVLKVENEIQDALQTKVSIEGNLTRGKIVIEYYTRSELERLIEVLKEKKDRI